jgi:hypothetical protein
MKVFRIILKWIAVSLVIQFVILGFAEVYLATGFDFGLKKFRITLDLSFLDRLPLKLPAGRTDNIRVSYDAMYFAYASDKGITIYSIGDRKILKEIALKGYAPAFFKWLPDRDILVYSFNDPDQVALETYDASNGIAHQYPPMQQLPAGSKAQDAALSVQTNVIYLKVKTAEDSSSVYRYNIMDQLEYVLDLSPDAAILSTSAQDNLLYSAPYANDVLVIRNGVDYTYESAYFDLPVLLLGRDYNDVIYLAEEDANGRIPLIRSGKISDLIEGNFTDYKLPSPAKPSEIFVAADESIYRIDASSKTALEIKTGIATKYDGVFADATSDYILSVNSGYLKFAVRKK